ncbi:hypothetical protein B0T21DRAFT_94333 [Apiosordaria backusii]|uniref:T6SS Phospholipase effector Tle1-like catalytic domain-containing protein n=1 Tax=Apiosordaria backusii TaxID=314023 RepID=A0AA40ET24_9PEZI|nr:hypothetical protein B0T21DRAFT_94333 [Apiosordaria backusii]
MLNMTHPDSPILAAQAQPVRRVEAAVDLPPAQHIQQTQQRPPRLWIASFNGTWAGGVRSSRKTVVSELVDLISEDENVYEVPLNGVGSDGDLIDKIKGGVSGYGTLRNVLYAYRNLSKQYRNGDRIILVGYSRGAWAARYLAKLIHLVGLPGKRDERFYKKVYKACKSRKVCDPGHVGSLKDRYECKSVNIDALCCFDTVGSLGLPVTGLAKPFAIFRMLGNQQKAVDLVSDVVPNVQFSFHALSLHETRGPYTPTLMRGTGVHQVYFPGNHSNLGWIDEAEGLVLAPFAWMVGQLNTHLNIRFDETKLGAHFPNYSQPRQSSPQWTRAFIRPTRRFLLAIMGKKCRNPGRQHINCSGAATDLRIHIGARLRNDMDDKTVPGYVLMALPGQRPYWARRVTWTDTNSFEREENVAMRIEEAEVGELEARLLGLPDEAVSGISVASTFS